MKENADKWYFKPATLVVGFLCIGPLILPLAWFNPKFSSKKKIAISLAIVAVSVLLTALLANSVKSLVEYYRQLSQQLQQMR